MMLLISSVVTALLPEMLILPTSTGFWFFSAAMRYSLETGVAADRRRQAARKLLHAAR